MKNLLIIAIIMFALPAAAVAEVIDVTGKGGCYYEVHLEPDGHHWFYIVPGNKPGGGAQVTVEGTKAGKVAFVFYGLTNNHQITWVKDPKKVHPDWRAFSFAVLLDQIDELKMIEVQSAQGSIPGGSITKTDLLWLVEEAKRQGRFKDHTKAGATSDTGGATKPNKSE